VKRTACWLAITVAAGGGTGRGWAQEAAARAGSVRGVVTSTSAEPVPYAVVALAPGFGQRFTDETGAFAFPNVPPGTYRLVVRQVGFRPFDTTVVKVAGRAVAFTVAMDRLAVELTEITVVAARRCSAPGIPDSALAPELAAVFSQLRQNAERYALLADSYPFNYLIARTYTDYDDADKVLWTTTDTVQYRSNARSHYRPGDVVGFGPGPSRSTMPILRLPALSDLADSAFLSNHCFTFAGTPSRDGKRVVRFEFRAADSLRTPDIEGNVELDARSYQVRSATIRLTRPGRALPGLYSAASTITFAELFPNIVLPSRVDGTLVPDLQFGVRRRMVRSTEEQRLLEVRFVRELPRRREPGP
jgi:hypothetical protein